MKPTPVLLIHGAFCGGWVFDRFAEPLRRAGHDVTAPDLPGHATDAARDAAAGFSMSDYAKAIAARVGALDAPPVLIGHSLGGLVALLAAMRAKTAGVILLAPSAPWGVSGSTMEEAVSAVSLFAFGPYWAQAIEPDYQTFSHFTADRLTRPERKAIHGRMRPESGRALFETLNWWLDPFMTTLVRAEPIAAPILAIAGDRDVIHPPATVRETARRVGATFQSMPDMSHWLLGEPGWEAVSDRCLAWMADLAAPIAAQ
jgi:pimeloyl-ACP methyl ester carboxylesterase